MSNMQLKLDHFFIMTAYGAPVANKLQEIGLVEGAPNDHPGQGTANRRFFCANTTIELLYVRSHKETSTGSGSRLRFVDRMCSNASPFGLVVRADADVVDAPFSSWSYQPDYFPAGLFFLVGSNSDELREPMCICMPPRLPAPASPPEPCNREWTMTALRICVPGEENSSVLNQFSQCEGVEILNGKPHLATIEFNHSELGQSRNFSPDLPLHIYW